MSHATMGSRFEHRVVACLAFCRRLLNQSTHFSVASRPASKERHGLPSRPIWRISRATAQWATSELSRLSCRRAFRTP